MSTSLLYADCLHDDMVARFPEVLRSRCSAVSATLRVAVDLNVDAVLSIGEHGDYPYNERGQHLYPRKRFFDEAFAVMQESGRVVPFFNDKHWSYRWDWTREMFDKARDNGMPIMAGSSVPFRRADVRCWSPAGMRDHGARRRFTAGLESHDFTVWRSRSSVNSDAAARQGSLRIELPYRVTSLRQQRDGRWSQELADAAMQVRRQ